MNEGEFEVKKIEVIATDKDGYKWQFECDRAEVTMDGLHAVLKTDE